MDNFRQRGKDMVPIQGGSDLGSVTTTAKLALAGAAGSEAQQQQQLNSTSGPLGSTHQHGFHYADVAGPINAA